MAEEKKKSPLNGWKTYIGVAGMAAALAVKTFCPSHTVAYKIAEILEYVFVSTGVVGVAHKYKKGELPSGLRKNEPES